jgi:hypothetical protein
MVGRLRDGTSDLQGSQAVQVRFLGLVAFLLYILMNMQALMAKKDQLFAGRLVRRQGGGSPEGRRGTFLQ